MIFSIQLAVLVLVGLAVWCIVRSADRCAARDRALEIERWRETCRRYEIGRHGWRR